MNNFANQVVLITGAASGIGRQLAIQLAREGAAIGAIDLRPEPLQVLGSELAPARFAWAIGDVTDRTALQKATAQITQQLGPVDILIASAGIGMETSALQYQAQDIEAQIRVNLIGVSNSIEAVLPSMLTRRKGQIVGMSSLASYRGLPLMLGYCASKSGLNALLDGLRAEVKAYGVDVTTICPGWIRTPLTANVALSERELMEPEYAANQIIWAIRRRRAFHAFPAKRAWMLGLVRLLPCGFSDRITMFVFRKFLKKV